MDCGQQWIQKWGTVVSHTNRIHFGRAPAGNNMSENITESSQYHAQHHPEYQSLKKRGFKSITTNDDELRSEKSTP